MTAKILFVDDEASILEGIRRTVGRKLEVTTAVGPQEGLATLATQGPFAVVVSDMRMPIMSGAQFLAEARRLSPNTVRMILSGQADFEATIAAVNDGHIFRFLTKPCAPEALLTAVSAGLQQYQLIVAERELLEQTLSGAVQVLTEILGIVSPEAYGRSTRITRYAEAMLAAVAEPERWLIRLAAMLSQIGWIAVPEEITVKVSTGQQLNPEEQERFDKHREVAAKLIGTIPRLERVAAIIAGDAAPLAPEAVDSRPTGLDTVLVGRQILHAAAELDRLLVCGTPRRAAVAQVAAAAKDLPAAALQALFALQDLAAQTVHKTVVIKDLVPGMVFDEDVHSSKGLLLVKRGQEITPTLISRLRGYAFDGGVVEPLHVSVPV